MIMRRIHLLSATALLAALLGGCVTTAPVGEPVQLLAGLTESRNADYGTFTSSIPLGKLVRLHASFIWEKEETSTLHPVRWELTKEGKLIEKRIGNWYFVHSPVGLVQSFDTTVLGVGKFQAKLFVDDKLANTYDFEIVR
jgi:hypothetical protein